MHMCTTSLCCSGSHVAQLSVEPSSLHPESGSFWGHSGRVVSLSKGRRQDGSSPFVKPFVNQTGLVEVEDLGRWVAGGKEQRYLGGFTKGTLFMWKFHICSVASEESWKGCKYKGALMKVSGGVRAGICWDRLPASLSGQNGNKMWCGSLLSPPQWELKIAHPAQMESISLSRTVPPWTAWGSGSFCCPPRYDHCGHCLLGVSQRVHCTASAHSICSSLGHPDASQALVGACSLFIPPTCHS